jgi:hypothetical protein
MKNTPHLNNVKSCKRKKKNPKKKRLELQLSIMPSRERERERELTPGIQRTRKLVKELSGTLTGGTIE